MGLFTDCPVVSERVVFLDDIEKKRHILKTVLVNGEAVTFLRIVDYPPSHHIDEIYQQRGLSFSADWIKKFAGKPYDPAETIPTGGKDGLSHEH